MRRGNLGGSEQRKIGIFFFLPPRIFIRKKRHMHTVGCKKKKAKKQTGSPPKESGRAVTRISIERNLGTRLVWFILNFNQHSETVNLTSHVCFRDEIWRFPCRIASTEPGNPTAVENALRKITGLCFLVFSRSQKLKPTSASSFENLRVFILGQTSYVSL